MENHSIFPNVSFCQTWPGQILLGKIYFYLAFCLYGHFFLIFFIKDILLKIFEHRLVKRTFFFHLEFQTFFFFKDSGL